CRTLSLSIVRPSIIESALAEPHRGWITGLRMSEPLILAYGRGLLPEFPALPDGVIDLIPVDVVANAVITAAGTPPPRGQPAVYHVGSGARNPLRFRGLADHAHDYFNAHPLHDSSGAPIPVPPFVYPTRGGRMRRLGLLRRGLEAALTALDSGP